MKVQVLLHFYWGKQLEPLVAEYYSMHTNNKVRRVNAVLQHPDPDKALYACQSGLLRWWVVMKSKFWNAKQQESTAQNFGERVCLYSVLCQVQHQLAVTGKQAAHVCVLICGHETKIFKADAL